MKIEVSLALGSTRILCTYLLQAVYTYPDNEPLRGGRKGCLSGRLKGGAQKPVGPCDFININLIERIAFEPQRASLVTVTQKHAFGCYVPQVPPLNCSNA
jgi:hypothetical protein